MAIASLKDRARARMRGEPDPGVRPPAAAAHRAGEGIVLSDRAARLMAEAIRGLLRS